MKTRRSRALPFVGSEYRIKLLTQRLEDELRRFAAATRRQAHKAEAIADKIAHDRNAGNPLTKSHFVRARMALQCDSLVFFDLVGVDYESGWDGIVDKLFPSPNTMNAQQASIVTVDVLQQAVSIAKSARAEEIDWTQEPLTERERKIRARYLQRSLDDDDDDGLSGVDVLLLSARIAIARAEPAADLQAAIDTLRERQRRESAEELSADLREIADELDDEKGSE